MGDVQSDVSGVMDSMGRMTEGLAAKNATMKDGPPKNGGEDQGQTKVRSPLEKYEARIAEINGNPNLQGADKALQHAKALSDLAMEGGPAVFKALSGALGSN